jgi:hypothetical protein
MCYIGNNKFLIAWKQTDGIGTVVYDAAAPNIPEKRFINRNDIDDDAAVACEGSPAIACKFSLVDKPSWIVWKHQDKKLRERKGRLRADGTIDFSSNGTRTLLFPNSDAGYKPIKSAPDLFPSGSNVEGTVIVATTGGDFTSYDQAEFRPYLEDWAINDAFGVMNPAPENIAMARHCCRPSGWPDELAREFEYTIFLLPAPQIADSVVRISHDNVVGGVFTFDKITDISWQDAFGNNGSANFRPDLTFNPGR